MASALPTILYVEVTLLLVSGVFLVPLFIVMHLIHVQVSGHTWMLMAAWGALFLLLGLLAFRLIL